MDWLAWALLACLQGITAVVPLSDSGHQVVFRIWFDPDRGLDDLAAVASIGCLAALVVVMRRRLARAFAEGIRGIARPAVLQASEGGRDAVGLVLASVVAATVTLLLRPFMSHLNRTPLVAAAAMLLTAAALASTAVAPPPEDLGPSALGALLVGLAQGLAVVPGASRIGAAFVVMRWLGVGGWRAAETAMLVTLPVMALEAALWGFGGPELRSLGGATTALVLALAAVSARVAVSWWRSLCDTGRTPLLAVWLVTASAALLAFGQALPVAGAPAPAPSTTAFADGGLP